MFNARMPIMPQTFVVVGCGGTGSRLVPLLAQFIKTCPWLVDPVIFLVDDDKVEQKNLLRQNFILPDVGKNKAEVLSSRYSKAYNTTIIPITEKVDNDGDVYHRIFNTSRDIQSLVLGNIRAAMIISCVDNMEARLAILTSFQSVWQHGGIFLDAGNEDVYGQVMVSTPFCSIIEELSHLKSPHEYLGLPGMIPVSAELHTLPLNLPFYLKTVDKVGEGSCADLDQTMAINSLVATTMFGVIQNIVYSRPLNFHRLNVSLNGIISELLTVKGIAGLGLDKLSLQKLERNHPVYTHLSYYGSTSLATLCTPLVSEYGKFKTDQDKKAAKQAKVGKEEKETEVENKAIRDNVIARTPRRAAVGIADGILF